MTPLNTYGSLLLVMLLLLHSLTASMVCLDFALHQEQIANEFCFHQAGAEIGCQGEGICQLHLRLQKAEDLQGHGQQAVKQLLPEQLFIVSTEILSTSAFYRNALPALRALPVIGLTDYSLAIDSPPRLG